MAEQHPIEALMKTAMESIREMVDVNTIVGDAVQAPDGTVIIPISKVTFGFAAGGGEYGNTVSEEDKRTGTMKEKTEKTAGNSRCRRQRSGEHQPRRIHGGRERVKLCCQHQLDPRQGAGPCTRLYVQDREHMQEKDRCEKKRGH